MKQKIGENRLDVSAPAVRIRDDTKRIRGEKEERGQGRRLKKKLSWVCCASSEKRR